MPTGLDPVTRTSGGGNDIYWAADYVSLAAAVAAIGATSASLTISTALSTNTLTVPATTRLRVIQGGQITVNVGQVLTLGLMPDAPETQIFAGTGTVSLPSGTVKAAWFPGADASVKIQAADTALSANKGTIEWQGNDNWSTGVTLNSDHHLKLGVGKLTATSGYGVYPLRLKSRTTVRGAGMFSTIFSEPTYNTGSAGSGWIRVIYTFGGTSYPFAAEDDDVEVSDLQILGANTYGDGGTGSAINMANGKNCLVARVYINGTRALGVTLGGLNGANVITATRDGGKVVDSLFRGIWAQNLNVVNGRNIVFANNTILDMALTGAAIDLETNTDYDFLENITVTGNTIDFRGTPSGNFPNGIAVSNGNATIHVGNIAITNNTLIGGKVTDSDGSVTNPSANALIITGVKDVVIVGNVIRRFGQNGLYAHGDRFLVANNIFDSVGGGGLNAMNLQLADSTIKNNLMLSRLSAAISAGSASDVIVENPTNFTATVNTAGTAVTRTAGDTFTPYPTKQGQTITINAVAYTVASVQSSGTLTLTTSAGTQTGVTATIPAAALYDRNTYEGNESDYSVWTGTNSSNPVQVTGTNSRVISHYDRTTKTRYSMTTLPIVTGQLLGSASYKWDGTFGALNSTSGVLNGSLGATTAGAVTATTIVANTSLAVGGGTVLTKAVVYTPSLTPASVAANTTAEETYTVSGLATTDKIEVNQPAPTVGVGIVGVRVSATDTLAITWGNFTAAAVIPTSGTYNVIAFRS